MYSNNKLYVGNVGDSRAIACQSGIATPLSTDHKPSDVGEKSRIEKVMAYFFALAGTFRLSGFPKAPRILIKLFYQWFLQSVNVKMNLSSKILKK